MPVTTEHFGVFIAKYRGGLLESEIDKSLRQMGLDMLDDELAGTAEITLKVKAKRGARTGIELKIEHAYKPPKPLPFSSSMFPGADGVMTSADPRQLDLIEADTNVTKIRTDA